MINYKIALDPKKSIFTVIMQFTAKNTTHELKLPTWIPGSYMIREFSKNIIAVSLSTNENSKSSDAKIEQINKNTWRLTGLRLNEKVELNYSVYAYDYGIRMAYLDTSRGYFNNTSLCLYVVGEKHLSHQIELTNVPDAWQVATGLRKIANNTYLAGSYDELIDCPFEVAPFTRLSFMVCGVEHEIVLSGIIPNYFNQAKLLEDVARICEAQIKLFSSDARAPFSHYTFLLHLGGDVYTGLEHRNSTSLLAPYYSLPTQDDVGDEYFKLLGLISHEYFHAWNVKRIKPECFSPYDLDTENYTKLLWWFEGITSYYDDLILYRSGVIDAKKYLSLMLNNLNGVYKYFGVANQTLANSSLTSWVKYYRQDANSPNMIVNYYIKGAIVGACLDILIRTRTNNQNSLDTILVGLYKKWQEDGFGVGDDEFIGLIQSFVSCDITQAVNQFVHSTEMIPLEEIFEMVGIDLIKVSNVNFNQDGKLLDDADGNNIGQVCKNKFELGVRLVKEPIGFKVLNVYSNTVAEDLGLRPEDIILAVNGIKFTDIDRQLGTIKHGDKLGLIYLRREQVNIIESVVSSVSSCDIYHMKVIDSGKLKKWL